MEYTVTNKAVTKFKSDCLIIPVGPSAALPEFLLETLPEATISAIKACIKLGDFAGKAQQTTIIAAPEGLEAKRLLLLGTGTDQPLSIVALAKIVQSAISAVKATGAKSLSWLLSPTLLDGHSVDEQLRETVRLVDAALYRFDQYRSKKSPATVTRCTFMVEAASTSAKQAVVEGKAIAAGVALARDLGNEPPNVCFPAWLSELAHSMGKQYDKLKVSIVSEKQAEKLGMGAFCAVSRGSEREGQIIVFEYKGAKGKPTALVGKGITFDTGGISLKPGSAMDEMKYDMCGAASVFGTVKAVCEMDLPIHLVACVVAAENMPDGRACRPGDIVKTMSGQTVEILNTDAEGRLVLCDALTYVQQRYKPETVVDIATLTGACVVALGSHAQAVYANDDALSEALLSAGKQTGDRGWAMPLWDDYQEQLDSPFADMANIGGPKGGSITAACFLSRFTKESRWAHLDIAGTAWVGGGKGKGATGRPVPMLTRYLMNTAKTKTVK
ncbi:MAG: leucyl aminopeptidase [Gammaproteobacteria bacterium]|jgi:leucyl aminopeptidase|nr:leucyl aminopeptidase [Gammaproteobacteria bacterium]MBQ0775283.1 leucyl aminopeptidase [Gammaproteobacteria bacterium]